MSKQFCFVLHALVNYTVPAKRKKQKIRKKKIGGLLYIFFLYGLVNLEKRGGNGLKEGGREEEKGRGREKKRGRRKLLRREWISKINEWMNEGGREVETTKERKNK